jgi:glyoxylase-like metal-dependent hydrolase (beta-lactamase superfamily II)
MLRLLMLPAAAFIRVESCSPDLVIDSAERSLLDWGIPGRLIHTPGHTPGSMSLLLRSGEAFVGDLAMDAMPMRISPGLPVFAEDIDEVRESWKRLLEQGAKTIYPAHGDPFSAEVIKKQILQVHERPQTIRAGA